MSETPNRRPYCDGQYNVTEIVNVSGLNEIQSLRVVAEAYQNRADAAEKRCHKLVVERDSAYQEIGRLRASLNCIAWPTAWANIPEHQLTVEYLRHVAQDALAIGVPAARRRADDLIRDAELRHRSLSERHWTCMKCGGSWNCDRAESAPERGNHAPVCKCPYCERDALRAVVERLVKKCKCGGTGKWRTDCTLCGDSTFDHYCNNHTEECDDSDCLAARAALAARS